MLLGTKHEVREYAVVWVLVVGIHERDELASRNSHAGVPGRAGAGIGLMDNLDARIARGIFVKHLLRAVGRAVVDADDLNLAQRLRQHRIQTFRQIRRLVVHRDDYGDFYLRCALHTHET